MHVRLLRELGGELVAVCGRTLGAATAFGHAAAYDDPVRMLRECAPEIVHVCSPHHLHAGHSIAALDAGAHVLCEKPMATSIDDGHRMIEAAARANRIGAVAYTYRGYPLVEVLREQVAAGALRHDPPRRRLLSLAGRLAADKYVWMFSPGTTGASYALMDLGVHWLDLVEFVSGQRIVEITAQFSTHQPERIWHGNPGEGSEPPGTRTEGGGIRVRHGLEEQADLLIRLSNGAAGSATISGVAPGHPNTIALSLDGSERGADWNQQDPNVWIERSTLGSRIIQRAPEALPRECWMSKLPAGHAEGYVDAFRNCLPVSQAWSAMRGGRGGYRSFADGLRGLRLIDAAVRSAADRRATGSRTDTHPMLVLAHRRRRAFMAGAETDWPALLQHQPLRSDQPVRHRCESPPGSCSPRTARSCGTGTASAGRRRRSPPPGDRGPAAASDRSRNAPCPSAPGTSGWQYFTQFWNPSQARYCVMLKSGIGTPAPDRQRGLEIALFIAAMFAHGLAGVSLTVIPASAAMDWMISPICVSSGVFSVRSSNGQVRHARLLQQRLRLGNIARRDRQLRVEIRAGRQLRLVVRHEQAGGRDLVR